MTLKIVIGVILFVIRAAIMLGAGIKASKAYEENDLKEMVLWFFVVLLFAD